MCYRFATAGVVTHIRQALRLSFHPLNYRRRETRQSDFERPSLTHTPLD
jgi:hypothetical protein